MRNEPSAARSAIKRAACWVTRGMKKITSAPNMGRNVIALRYGKLSTRVLSSRPRYRNSVLANPR